MKKELYVVEFSSSNYAGAPEHCRVWAESEETAIEAASDYAHDFYYQQDSDQWYEENTSEQEDEDYYNEPGSWATLNHAFPQAGSSFEKFIADAEQAEAFYPIVNEYD